MEGVIDSIVFGAKEVGTMSVVSVKNVVEPEEGNGTDVLAVEDRVINGEVLIDMLVDAV